MNSSQNKVLILCGPRPSYGYCPLPPLTNSAPERNIFRLAEHDYGGDFQLQVISACGYSQKDKLNTHDLGGKYVNIPFPDFLYPLSQGKIFQTNLSLDLSRSILKTNDPFSFLYLQKASEYIKKISPNMILINSFPQYIQIIRKKFPNIKLGLFVRGGMGGSRKFLNQLDLIITNSEGISEYVRKLLDNAHIPIIKIPNSLEESFCSSPKAKEKMENKIIYFGRIDKVKGVYELLQALNIVEKEINSVSLDIIGGNFGSNRLTEYEQHLKNYAKTNKLKVNFIGKIPNEKIPKYITKASLAVFPSICNESFGMVALESMRCGLPVIASRRPGFEELIVDGETGYLVNDPENITELSKKIIQILYSPDERISMGDKGYERSLLFTPARASVEFRRSISGFLN